MPTRRDNRLRHAQYYAEIANHANWELYYSGKQTEGLELFDGERRQIDTAWQWALEQPPAEDTDVLLLNFANATVFIGDLRYSLREERIPRLEAQAIAARRLRQQQSESDALGNLGLAYANLGDYQRAITLYEQDLAIRREIGDRGREGNTLSNLGLVYANLGEYLRAITCYEQALSIAYTVGNQRGEGNALGNLGIAFNALGEYQKAIGYHEQHLTIVRELGDRRGESNALGNLGIAYKNLGYYQKAVAHIEQAITFAEATSDVQGVALNRWNLGLLYEAQGDLERAVPLMQEYADFLNRIGHPDTGKITNQLKKVQEKLNEQPALPLQKSVLSFGQDIANAAPNQGAQGVFHGSVAFSGGDILLNIDPRDEFENTEEEP